MIMNTPDMTLAICNTHLAEALVVKHLLLIDYENTVKCFNRFECPKIEYDLIKEVCALYFDTGEQDDIILALGGEKEKAFATFVSVVKSIINEIDYTNIDKMFRLCNPTNYKEYGQAFLWLAEYIIMSYAAKPEKENEDD